MKLLSSILMIIVLLLFLTACGGSEDAAVEQTPEPAPAEAESAAAEEAPAAAEAPTEQPAEAQPTATNEPEPTATEQPAEMSTEEAPAAADETAQEPAASGEGWGESGTTAQTACDHPYMPLREGANWTYESDDGSFTWEVTSVDGDLLEATAEVTVTVDDVTLNYEWNCEEGKGISSVDFAGQGLASAMPEMTVELTSAEGEFLPPAAEMTEGATWDAKFEQDFTLLMGEGDEQLEVSGSSTISQTSTIVSANPVVAAGVTVDGVQVEQVSDITMTMQMMGQDVDQTIPMTSRFDLGRGVGMVRQELDNDFGMAAVELTSYFIP